MATRSEAQIPCIPASHPTISLVRRRAGRIAAAIAAFFSELRFESALAKRAASNDGWWADYQDAWPQQVHKERGWWDRLHERWAQADFEGRR